MLMSRLLAPTLRQDPSEAEVASHKLMLRAGLIRKLSPGVFTIMPVGLKTLRKIENIIREEMNAAGAQELFMPVLVPEELWRETGRWSVYGPELMRVKDRHDRFHALGPTHEEVITHLVRNEVRSYRDIPVNLYQIQTKFRDEIRPRFGVMRGREFLMKDAYSFDLDQAGLDESYKLMYDAYCRIFTRCGLEYRPVEADTGAIGGDVSHEFMVLAEVGEDTILYCDRCRYAANLEKARSRAPAPPAAEPLPMEVVDTPDVRTIAELVEFLGVPAHSFVKTLLYTRAHGALIAAMVRGDRELNEAALKRALGEQTLEPAAPERILAATGAPVGFAGPVGLKGVDLIVADPEVTAMSNAVVGANQVDKHIRNVNPGRDFTPGLEAELREAQAGEGCPACQGALLEARGIEVGHIFKLGAKYSEAMNAAVQDENGDDRLLIMGCYGIGVTRTMAAAIEAWYDKDGIVWPMSIAPFHAVVIPANSTNPEHVAAANRLYKELTDLGIETVLDDRNERPGVKFKDADLIGFPFKIVAGKALAEGRVEIKPRTGGDAELADLDQAAATVADRVQAALEALKP